MPNKRYLILAMITFITALIIFRLENIIPIKNEKLFRFPMQIGEWTGTDSPMEDWVFESLETKFAILRNYRSVRNDKINLAIVWYDDKEIAFHSAAACLGGIGNRVKEDTIYSMETNDRGLIKIGRLITDQYESQTIVLYYYISDGFITADQKEVRMHVLKTRLQFKRTSAAFVRIMSPLKGSKKRTIQKMELFLKDTLPTIIDYTKTK